MKTTKKLLAMALAAAMVVTAFAGCSGNNDTSSADSTSSASSEASTSSDASTSDESSATEDDGTIHPMRIVQPGTLCPDYETGMAAVNEKLKEDGVNIEVSVTRIPWDAYAEKLNLMLTTGEEFELLHVMQDVKNLSAIAGMGAISSIHDSIQNYPDLSTTSSPRPSGWAPSTRAKSTQYRATGDPSTTRCPTWTTVPTSLRRSATTSSRTRRKASSTS
ncbi:MAG: hypothetical protein ACLUNH_06180 [Hominenteromicrobium sp.]|uniref:hypothetical protein n=1 Tax=Hominenteromicrobium sp. TaxID=3073581 RepID=UPI003994FE50